jgi:hypothetical protein
MCFVDLVEERVVGVALQDLTDSPSLPASLPYSFATVARASWPRFLVSFLPTTFQVASAGQVCEPAHWAWSVGASRYTAAVPAAISVYIF